MKKIIVLIVVALVLLACDFGFNLGGSAPATPTTVAQPAATSQPQPPAATQVPPPAATQVPPPVATKPPPPAATNTVAATSDLPLFDGFDNPAFDKALNLALWTTPDQVGSCPGVSADSVLARQISGALQIEMFCPGSNYVLEAKPVKRQVVKAFEARIKIDSKSVDASGKVWMQINGDIGGNLWRMQCEIQSPIGGKPNLGCGTSGEFGAPGAAINHDQWYTIRIEFNPTTYEVGYYLDGKLLGKHTSVEARRVNTLTLGIGVSILGGKGFGPVYVDDVRISP